MVIDYVKLGQRIKKIRKQKKLTQEKLAEHLDVSTVYISQMENGRTRLNLEMLVRVANLLDTDPGYFLNGTAYSSPEYLTSDLASLLQNCTPAQRQLILDVAQRIAGFKEESS